MRAIQTVACSVRVVVNPGRVRACEPDAAARCNVSSSLADIPCKHPQEELESVGLSRMAGWSMLHLRGQMRLWQ